MKKNTKLIISSITVIVIAGISLTLLNNKNTCTESNTPAIEKDHVLNKLETTTEIKKVPFETADEMFEYSDTLMNISGIEEATNFITSFLGECNKNAPEYALPYYDSSLWNIVLDKNLLPYFDSTNTVTYTASNIDIVEGKKENEYYIKYTLMANESDNGNPIAEIKRNDKITLSKTMGNIKIIDYTKETIDHKFY